jgi:hypothetical protein
MNGYKITNLLDHSTNNTCLSLGSADSRYYFNTTTLNNIANPTASLSMNGQKITNLATPTASTDTATKAYTDSNFYLNTTPINSITAPTATLSLNSQKITNLATPTANTDAVTKGYVDSIWANRRFYKFILNVGTIPSSVESFQSDDNFITSVSYADLDSNTASYQVNFNNPWSVTTNVQVLTTVLSNSTTAGNIGFDNDLGVITVILDTAS